jgi:hypothetical protein
LFLKKFQNQFQKFLNIFSKKILSEKKCVQKVSKNIFSMFFIVWKTRFGTFLAQIWVKKFRSKKGFLKKKFRKVFFSKKISKSLEKISKNILSKKYYFQKNITSKI